MAKKGLCYATIKVLTKYKRNCLAEIMRLNENCRKIGMLCFQKSCVLVYSKYTKKLHIWYKAISVTSAEIEPIKIEIVYKMSIKPMESVLNIVHIKVIQMRGYHTNN